MPSGWTEAGSRRQLGSPPWSHVGPACITRTASHSLRLIPRRSDSYGASLNGSHPTIVEKNAADGTALVSVHRLVQPAEVELAHVPDLVAGVGRAAVPAVEVDQRNRARLADAGELDLRRLRRVLLGAGRAVTTTASRLPSVAVTSMDYARAG